jgi:uncharacterized protein YkwD
MKTQLLKPLLILTLSLFVISCSNDDDGIYFEKIAEDENISVSYSALELEILDLINVYRETKGLNTLTKLDIVSYVAETHTEYMVETGLVNHDNFPERNQKLVVSASAKSVGENVAYGFNSAKGVVDAWLKSDAHRAIIENENYTHFGVSTERNLEGRNYFTQIFIKR